jgi:dephospho-CoA kinase
MSFIIGLTGPTGSGKSTACRWAETIGWLVIDCDKVAREATASPETLEALTAVFGGDILLENGELNRKALAGKAFSSKENTELLNQTILPFIVALIKEKIKASSAENILLDAPTLYESGADLLCDGVCVITAPEEIRLDRIMARDSLSQDEAKLRMSAGKSDEFYKARTPHIIYNDGDAKALVKKFNKVLEEIGGI